MEVLLMQALITFCRTYPEVIIFLVLGLGYLVGRIKVAGFSLGETASILILALLIGQVHVQINDLLPNIAFTFFIFAIGYKVGPDFFSSLKSTAVQYILLSAFFCIAGLITALLIGRFFHFNAGLTAGMFGGALTQSAVIGTATDAIKQLPVLASQKSLFTSDVTVAYALTYIFGMAGLIIFYRILVFIFKNNLSKSIDDLHQTLGIHQQAQGPSLFSWSKEIELRAYQASQKTLLGKTVKQLQEMMGKPVRVEQIKRKGKLIQGALLDLQIESNDLLAIAGTDASLIDLEETIGPEVYDNDVLNITGEVLKVCVLRKLIGKTIADVQKEYGYACFIKRLMRQGHQLPLLPNTRINRCDIIEVVGSKPDVESFVKEVGYPERPTSMTDIVTVAVGCLLGTLLGLIVVQVYALPITLGVGGGALVVGLILGWLRSLHPTFGQIPAGALWIFTNLGLNFFVVCVGLNAAPAAFVALKTAGLNLFFAGVLLTLIPTVISLLFGKYILRLNSVLLLGGLTGAGTCTPALSALQESLGSPTPILGYTIPYAFSNVLLTIFGSVVINVMHLWG
jgi:putative transport protein